MIFDLNNVDICLIKSLNDKAHLIYDGVRFKRTLDLCLLKNFIENVVGLEGFWKSPGGKSKQFISTNVNKIPYCSTVKMVNRSKNY